MVEFESFNKPHNNGTIHNTMKQQSWVFVEPRVKVKNVQAYKIKKQIVIGKNKSDSILDLFLLV